MTKAWSIFKKYPQLGFAKCLSNAWRQVKEESQLITPAQFHVILERLRPVSIGATHEYYHLVNSKYGRKVMKRDDGDDTKQMIASGEVFLGDLIKSRKKTMNHVFRKYQGKKTFRNRIINLENCERINIKEFIAQMQCKQ